MYIYVQVNLLSDFEQGAENEITKAFFYPQTGTYNSTKKSAFLEKRNIRLNVIPKKSAFFERERGRGGKGKLFFP
ncbi:MAG: hypothetical protein IJW33_06730 [Lentisphaeria bacterium]|nr:hypothetical protein [Lentisphaeria bacterium]